MGDIDIYLFDQIARGRFDDRRAVLDAGCGDGRNLVYLLSQGVTCYGIDRDPVAVARVQALAARLAPTLPPDHFVAGELDALPWADATMDAVICSAVLHFSRDASHFLAQLTELWRVLAPGGLNGDRYAIDDRAAHLADTQAMVRQWFKLFRQIDRLDLLEDWVVHLYSDESPEIIQYFKPSIQQLESLGFAPVTVDFREGVDTLVKAIKA